MEELNILGDIGGQYDALKRLVAKMPKAKVLAVGDLVDRGPKSRQVVEWFMDDPTNRDSLMGNHEELLLDCLRGKIPKWEWDRNGGVATMISYGAEHWSEFSTKIPAEHIEWLKARPLYYKQKGLLVTHAPIAGGLTLKEALVNDHRYQDGTYITWCRMRPAKIENTLQIFGHNARDMGLLWFHGNDKGVEGLEPPKDPWAVCIDDSRQKVLTGLHYPSLTIYQEPF